MGGTLVFSTIPAALGHGLALGLGGSSTAIVKTSGPWWWKNAAASSGTATSASAQTGSGTSVEARQGVELHARIARRCKHLSDDDKKECERLARLHIESRGDAEARAESRVAHGKFMSGLRHRMHEDKEDMKEFFRELKEELKEFFGELMDRLRVALRTRVDAEVKVCEGKKDDEQKKCFADARVHLNAAVDAAVKALLPTP